ncbi:hypothetical protein F0562_000891 [Nyssa sinensis]|uniref:Bidirectional sugar transporter SWEET n=1 Tax=Nyssa sinensis TaxID=561372 RepID=A0A5J5C5R3_9ASTE|nr:hypothetical protein F0562_000891 [Nyssa sinensis]
MLTFYYALLKTNAILLITINSIGIVIESIYLVLFMIYATKEAKIYTTKLLILFNVGAYGFIMLFTMLFSHGHQRSEIVGWICATFSVCVFAAPLAIMRLVIKTKSVKYMPFSLSFFLTLSAVMWFFYGFLKKDYFIATPNILGFLFGIVQMLLYIIYKDKKKEVGLHESRRVVDLSSTLEMQENCQIGLDQLECDIPANEDAKNKPTQKSETNV